MLAAIHQLHYLPWLRYVEKIIRSDVFIVLDDAQFVKNEWHNRNRIKTAQGPLILTVPVIQKLGQRLDETLIDNRQHWREKHWKSIEMAYAKAPCFADYAGAIKDIYSREWSNLNDLNWAMLRLFVGFMKIKTKIVAASELHLEGKASQRLVDLCKTVKADSYYCGAFAAQEYLDRKIFEDAGIEIVLQHWKSPEYPQLHTKAGYIGDLAILDLLFNMGPKAAEILVKGGIET